LHQFFDTNSAENSIPATAVGTGNDNNSDICYSSTGSIN